MIAIQADNLSLDAVEMVPLLLKSAPRNPRAAKAHALLGRWNHFMLASRPEPLIYTAWLVELQRGLLADELGDELYEPLAAPNVPLLMRILREQPGWCDDGGTRATETCDDQIALALDRALDVDRAPPGRRHRAWQWGREHLAVHRHPLFDGVPLLRDLASVRFPSDGGAQTLNRAQPSYRGAAPLRRRAWRRLPRRLRFRRPRQQPLRHAARPVGQHAVAVGAQFRRAAGRRCATSRSPAPAPKPAAPPSAR